MGTWTRGFNRPLKNYCARLCGVEITLKMLMYSSYTALFRLISPCLAVARYIFQRPVSGVPAHFFFLEHSLCPAPFRISASST